MKRGLRVIPIQICNRPSNIPGTTIIDILCINLCYQIQSCHGVLLKKIISIVCIFQQNYKVKLSFSFIKINECSLDRLE